MPDPTDLPDTPPLPNEAPAAAATDAPNIAPTTAPTTAPADASTDALPAEAAHADDPGDTPMTDGAAADDDSAPDTTAAPAGSPALPQLTPAAAAELLRQHFPALFAGPAKPFKLRIQQDIQARAPGVFSKTSLSGYFRRHTGSTAYLMALSKASHRFDLDGQPAGELSDEHKQAAVAELARRRQITRDREQQAHAQQREQQRETQRAQMAQQAEQQQARQARAALLRDFQRTTLTLANFCALKRMTPDVLNPLLDQARQEAAEAPPMPPRAFDDRRGPRPDNRQDSRPDNRPDNRTDNRSDNRPDNRPDHRPDHRRDASAPRDLGGPRRDDRRPTGAPAPRGPRGPSGQS